MIPAGTVVGRYFEVGRFIAAGTTGEVYRGIDRKTSRPVAIKFLRAEYSSSEELVARFEREAIVAAKIDSPYVARVIDAGSSRKTKRLWIAFELFEGETLEARMRRGAVPLLEASPHIERMLLGLATAHDAGVVHRDIKPSNLFVEADTHQLRILDFGVAKLLPTGSLSSSGLTRFDDALGTPAYMSPEQLQSARHVDLRTDLYSAGCVAFRLLSGRLPFDEPTIAQLLVAKSRTEPPSLTRATGELWPPSAERWIARLIATAPSDRFASALEAAEDWRHVSAVLLASLRPSVTDPLDVATDVVPARSK